MIRSSATLIPRHGLASIRIGHVLESQLVERAHQGLGLIRLTVDEADFLGLPGKRPEAGDKVVAAGMAREAIHDHDLGLQLPHAAMNGDFRATNLHRQTSTATELQT